MSDSSISQERLALIAEAALRQLESGRDLDSVVMKLEAKGLSPGEAQDLGEKVYKEYIEKQEAALNNQNCSSCKQNAPEEGYAASLCTGCRSQLVARPFPMWIKLATGVVSVILLFACFGIQEAFTSRLAFERGLKYEASGNYAIAISQYQKALQYYPDSTKILVRQTVAYFKNNDVMAAAATVKKIQGRKVDKETANEINGIIDKMTKLKDSK